MTEDEKKPHMTLAEEAEFAKRWLLITKAIKNAAGKQKEKKEVKYDAIE